MSVMDMDVGDISYVNDQMTTLQLQTHAKLVSKIPLECDILDIERDVAKKEILEKQKLQSLKMHQI